MRADVEAPVLGDLVNEPVPVPVPVPRDDPIIEPPQL